MGNQLAGKVAVITGAGNGIGRAYARCFAREGAQVVVNDLPGEAEPGGSPAETVAREIVRDGGTAIACNADVADYRSTEAMMGTAVERFGTLDVVVANAGVTRPGRVYEITEEDWNAVMGVHAGGTFNCIRAASPRLIEGGGGSIVTVGDMSVDLYFPKNVAYRAAKAALAVLTLYASAELAEHNVNVNSVMPGGTDTAMHAAFSASLDPDKRDGFLAAVSRRYGLDSADELAPAAPETVPALGAYLCTAEARGITGQLFDLRGHQIRLFAPGGRHASLEPADGKPWTIDSLGEAIVPWLTDAADGAP